MYPENPKGTQVILGSMNMGYVSDTPTVSTRTHNLFRPKREPIPLGHSDGLNTQSVSETTGILLSASKHILCGCVDE